jgi:hypothetical protein
MSEPQTVFEALRSDHHGVSAMLADPGLAGAGLDAAADREQLVMALVRHFVAEEQYLYPLIRTHLDGGADLARDGIAADRDCEARLKSLEDPELAETALREALAGVAAAFDEHVSRLEQSFELLAVTCDPEQLAELGDDIIGAEQLAPTRPRAVAPESPTANKVISFVEGYLDHVRDYYTKRGVDPTA